MSVKELEPCVNCGTPAHETSSWGGAPIVVHANGVQLCPDGSRRLACLSQVGVE